MGMFRFTSWITDSTGCDKAVDGQLDNKMVNGTRPVVEITPAKRKRSGSADVLEATRGISHGAKRPKPVQPLKSFSAPPEAKLCVEASGGTKNLVDPDLISNTINSQFSLEILLKHNELRLINQELAKCQVALEQLRRCHLIPYPSTEGSYESMVNVSNGTGPALRQRDNVPQWAAPFGVTEGPYSRHYSKWLIPDPSFDGGQVEWQEGSRAGKTVPEGRATRNSFTDSRTPVNKSRSQRQTTGQKLQALPNGYPQAKEKAGPCVLKRADGQTVKLVCIDCNRENFSSTQGFINHCRIAHRRDFKSHEEAASQSGQPIEVDEVGAVVGEEKAPAPSNGLVHPLIRTASTDRAAIKSILERIKIGKEMFSQGKLPGVHSIPSAAISTPARAQSSFVPSSATPNLSELMRKRGFGGDLDKMVDDAKTHIDFDEMPSEDENVEYDAVQDQLTGIDGAGPMPRMPARAGMSPAPFGRPGSAKGGIFSGISPRLSHALPKILPGKSTGHLPPRDELSPHEIDVDMMDVPRNIDLSPNTVASNNAPSLVSDDGEYDDQDVDSGSSAGEEEDSDVAEIDIEDEVAPRTVLRNRADSGSEGMRLRKEEKEKHVTFVSPVKEAGTGKERRTRRA